MITKHTPGPWKTFQTDIAIGVESDRSDVAWIYHPTHGLLYTARSVEEDRANARLIAASPDLLESLRTTTKMLQEWIDNQPPYDDALRDREALAKAKAAIAKATGVVKWLV